MTSILHVWDQAGVACILAKYQKKKGYESVVIKRDGFDPFRIMDFYNQTTYKAFFSSHFFQKIVKQAEKFDIIHVHDLFELIPKLRKKYPKKKIVLHYHGTKLRTTDVKKRRGFEENADNILVSTPDLLDFVDGSYLANPVDTELFAPRKIPNNNKALGFVSANEPEEKLGIEKTGLKINTEFVPRTGKILYENMPDFLSEFEYYVDLKWVYPDRPAPAFSMIGLQSLSLGLKVINHEYKVTKGLPDQHLPEMVVKKLDSLYDDNLS